MTTRLGGQDQEDTMPAKSRDEIRRRLIELGAEALADTLLTLSVRNVDVDAATQRLIATGDERLKRYKAGLAGLRRAKKFIDWSRSRQFAAQLEGLLENLADCDCSPKTGVELTSRFFECDESVLGRCDDSNGSIGDVFRCSARARWVSFAKRCDEKAWLVDHLERLYEKDDYGVRDALLENCEEYLAEDELRELAQRFWRRHEAAEESQSRHWLRLICPVAKALADPALYEKAILGYGGGQVGGLYLDIARAYVEARSPTGALRWLESSHAESDFRSGERDELLLATYEQLGLRKKQASVAQRIFERTLSVEALDQVVAIVGVDRREALIEETARRITRGGLSFSGAHFLLEIGRGKEADGHVIAHRSELDGDAYTTLLGLAKRLEAQGFHVSTTCVYRALVESILDRGQSKYYSHAVRYWRKLDALAEHIHEWRGIDPALRYRTQLREQHARKYAFWSKVEPQD
jgi:hypothetical protein